MILQVLRQVCDWLLRIERKFAETRSRYRPRDRFKRKILKQAAPAYYTPGHCLSIEKRRFCLQQLESKV